MSSSIDLEPAASRGTSSEPPSTSVSQASEAVVPASVGQVWFSIVAAGTWAGTFLWLLEGVERNLALGNFFFGAGDRVAYFRAAALTALGTIVVAASVGALVAFVEWIGRRAPVKSLASDVTVRAIAFALPVAVVSFLLPDHLYHPFVDFLDGLAEKGIPFTTRMSHHPNLAFTAALTGCAILAALLRTETADKVLWARFRAYPGAIGAVVLASAGGLYVLDARFFVGHYEATYHTPLGVLQVLAAGTAFACFGLAERLRGLLSRLIVPAAIVAVGAGAWAVAALDSNQNVKTLLWRRGATAREFAGLMAKTVDFDRDTFSPMLGNGDGNDRNAGINPLAKEIPGNGVDENGLGGDGQTTLPEVAPDLSTWRQPEPLAVDAPKRNVLFLSIDALRADHLGVYGYARATTPNLDRWASRSLVFLNSSSQASNTGHSFSSIATSSYGDAIFDPATPNLATVFKRNGYDTVFLSKRIMSGLLAKKRWSAYKEIIYRGMEADDQIRTGRKSSDAATMADKAIEFLKNHAAGAGRKPFYAWMHFTDPHAKKTSYVPASNEFQFGQRDIDLYDACIAYTDVNLGRLFSYLETSGLLETTIVVITADHGEAFGEHGEYFHGSRPYREQNHVPLIVRAPGVQPRRIDLPVGSIDIAPTMLCFAGIAPPSTFQGINLLRLGREGAMPPRLIVSETPRNLTEPNFLAWGVTDTVLPEWHLVYDAKGNTWELYDTRNDPGERANLIERRPDVAGRLRRAFGEWMDIQSRHPAFRGWGPVEPVVEEADDAAGGKPRRRRR